MLLNGAGPKKANSRLSCCCRSANRSLTEEIPQPFSELHNENGSKSHEASGMSGKCWHCLTPFESSEALKQHLALIGTENDATATMHMDLRNRNKLKRSAYSETNDWSDDDDETLGSKAKYLKSLNMKLKRNTWKEQRALSTKMDSPIRNTLADFVKRPNVDQACQTDLNENVSISVDNNGETDGNESDEPLMKVVTRSSKSVVTNPKAENANSSVNNKSKKKVSWKSDEASDSNARSDDSQGPATSSKPRRKAKKRTRAWSDEDTDNFDDTDNFTSEDESREVDEVAVSGMMDLASLQEKYLKAPRRRKKKRKWPYPCDRCEMGFRGKKTLRNHGIKVHGDSDEPQVYICEMCGKSSDNRFQLQRHMIQHSDVRSYVCDTCGVSFKTLVHMNKHKREVHKIGEKTYDCKFCSATHDSYPAHYNHLKTHSDSFEFKCHTCAKTFPRLGALKIHLSMTHKFTKRICQICDRTFEWNDVPCEHLQVTTEAPKADKPKTRRPRKPKTILPNQCVGCREIFTDLDSLRDHYNRDEGSSHKCCKCADEFKNKCASIRHVRTMHEDGSVQVCKWCGITFLTKEELKSHIKVHTDEEYKHACSFCGKRFMHNCQRRVHESLHGDETPFSCEICGKAFKARYSLAAHKMIHGAKRWKCDVCHKLFTKSNQLHTHYRIHTGEKPYECDLCGRRFTQAGDCRKHRNTHEGGGGKAAPKRPRKEPPPVVEEYLQDPAPRTNYIYACSDCGKTYLAMNECQNHLREHFRTGTNPTVVRFERMA